MRSTRVGFALAAGISLVMAGPALALPPKDSATTKVLYLSQVGCGSTAEKGQLLSKPGASDTGKCGSAGGAPVTELQYQAGARPAGDKYISTSKLPAFKVDGAKKITGQVSAQTWLPGGGGVGTIVFDLHLTGDTVKDDLVDFGKVIVSAPASPLQAEVSVPFSLSVPKSANGVRFASYTFTVVQRGLTFPMSAKALGGESYIIFPSKK